MSNNSPGHEPASMRTLAIFGIPIALALLMIPALMILVPSRMAQTEGTSATVAAVNTQSTPAQVHLTVKEWSFQPFTLQLPVGKPVTLVLDNKGQLDHDVTIPSLGVN